MQIFIFSCSLRIFFYIYQKIHQTLNQNVREAADILCPGNGMQIEQSQTLAVLYVGLKCGSNHALRENLAIQRWKATLLEPPANMDPIHYRWKRDQQKGKNDVKNNSYCFMWVKWWDIHCECKTDGCETTASSFSKPGYTRCVVRLVRHAKTLQTNTPIWEFDKYFWQQMM